MGTGGTISGIARYMRESGRSVRMIGVDPIGSLLHDAWNRGGNTEGIEGFTYKVEGIGEDFIPSTLDLSLIDEVVQVGDAESFHWARRLVREEGIFCGGSSGAALAGALRIARDLGPDRLVVVILPDSGSRYLSKFYDDDWMLEHGFLEVGRHRVSAREVSRARGLPALVTASPGDRMVDVIGRMRQYGISQTPVVGGDGALLGLVSEVDLLDHLVRAGHEHRPEESIESLLSRDVRAAPADAPLEDVLPDLLHSKVVVLIDELRRPQGILTVIDALEFLAAPEKA
jgi:cystathionine beta-synthase